MLCYTLMRFNFHCPNKVYVKECESNKSEIHQGDKCSGSWLGLWEDTSLPKGAGQTRNTTSLREQAPWHKGNWSLHPLHRQREKCPEETVLTFRGASAVQISLGGCRGLQAAQQQVTSPHWNPALILNPDSSDLSICYTLHRQTTEGPGESGCKCVDIGER